jgi:acyl carrier protein
MHKRFPFLVSIGALTLAGCKPQTTAPDSATAPPSAPKVQERVAGPAEPRVADAKPSDPKTTEVTAKVRKIVAEQLNRAPEAVLLTSTWQQLGADSLDFVELIMAWEEEFDVEITDENAVAMKTVGDAVSYLASRAKK